MAEEHPPKHAHASRATARFSVRRLEGRWRVAAAVAALALAGAFGFWLRGAVSARRRRIDFPPAPKLNAALASAQDRVKANPQDLKALVELGVLHFQKGKEFYADAINELEDARDLGALDPRLFYCLGVMYQEVGLYTFALEDYRRFLRHFPEDKEIRLLAAKLLYRQGSFAEAVQEYERLKFRFPNDALIEENLALSLWGAKDLDRAVESFTQLGRLGPDQAKRAEYYLGQIAYDKGDYKAAVEHLLKAQPDAGRNIGLAPERIAFTLAQTYQKLQQWPEAKAAWEQVLQLTPNDSKAKQAQRDVTRRLPRKSKKR